MMTQRYSAERIRTKLAEILFNGIVARLPNRPFGGLRPRTLRAMGAQIGTGVKLSRGIKVLGAKSLVLADDVAIAHSVVLDARSGLTIDQGALIGFESVLLSYTHAWPDPSRPVHRQGAEGRPIRVGPRAWIGARTFVLPGSTVGESTIIGAVSVVSGHIPAGVVAVGNPINVRGERRDRRADS